MEPCAASSELEPRPEPVPQSLKQMVLALCLAAWLVHVLFLATPNHLSFDETLAIQAAQHSVATRFVQTRSWGERWALVQHFSAVDRTGWIVFVLLWGYMLPSNGEMVYVLPLLAAIVAAAALTGAARNLYGDRGWLLCLLLISLSPLFLNYTVRALGTMPGVMWLCLALAALSSSSSVRTWVVGGWCLGMAFVTHLVTGGAVIAIGVALGCSAALHLRDKVELSGKLWRWGAGPLLGGLSAVVPLLILNEWSRTAGRSYVTRLLRHENLSFETVGPYGLWLRELCELDPMLLILLAVAVLYTFSAPWLSRRGKQLLGVVYVVLASLLISAVAGARARVFVSLSLSALLGIVLVLSGALDRLSIRDDREPFGPAAPAVFDQRALVVAVLAAIMLLTLWRSISNMPRLVFPTWPVFLLGMVGLLLRIRLFDYAALIRWTAVLGALLFALGAGGTYVAKSSAPRAHAYARQHPYLRQLTFQDFWETQSAMAALSTRARYAIDVIGPPATLYPASCYEEEPYKLALFRRAITAFDLQGVLSPEALQWASIFFEPGPGGEGLRPPAGTPEVPAVVRAWDFRGKPVAPVVHPYRGLQLPILGLDSQNPAEVSVSMLLPADPQRDNNVGLEVTAIGEKVPAGTRLTLSAFHENRQLSPHEAQVPIRGAIAADPDAAEPFGVVEWPLGKVGREVEVRLVAKLEVPTGKTAADVTCFIRRPFVFPPPASEPTGPVTDG